MKARLQLNLPHGQLFVTRVSSTITLAEIFKMVCDQKGLDPYKHELRHPTKPDVPLNMSNQLAHYNLTELSVINITGKGVLYPGPKCLFSATWPLMPKKIYYGLNIFIITGKGEQRESG